MVKKERVLKRELRLKGFNTHSLAARFKVSDNTVRNWISGRTHIPPKTAVRLLRMGIPKNAIVEPYQFA